MRPNPSSYLSDWKPQRRAGPLQENYRPICTHFELDVVSRKDRLSAHPLVLAQNLMANT